LSRGLAGVLSNTVVRDNFIRLVLRFRGSCNGCAADRDSP
jgi:hypothetical protein